MFKKNFQMKRAFTMIMVLIVLMSTTAFAATDTGVTVTGDTLSGGAITYGEFSAITLTGTLETASATLAIANIVDSRGTGAGWNLSLELTPLKEYNTTTPAYVEAGKVIPTGSIEVATAPVVTLADETSSPADTITPVATGIALDEGAGASVKLLTAAANGGMGSYAISAITATLTTRADAYAATYKTDATVAIVTGP